LETASAYFLKTARLGFRAWTTEDLPFALALWGDAKVTRLIGGPFSEEQIRKRLACEINNMREYGVQYWPVFLLSGYVFAGCCGLRPHTPEECIYELGFHFCAEHWGKGYAMESARAAIAYAFDSLGARGLFAGHHPDNTASQRVVEKLGFRFTHEEVYAPTGRMHRCYLLGAAQFKG
jgi:ribosomal-protein-alanine N-acetyltransferase